MDFSTLINNITPDIHQHLKRALELGKWPDGRVLTQQQKEHTMQAVIAYEYQHLKNPDRVGYIDRGHKSDGDVCNPPSEQSGGVKPIKWS